MTIGLGLSFMTGCQVEDGIDGEEYEERAFCPWCEVAEWEELEPVFPDPPAPTVTHLDFDNVDNHAAKYPEFVDASVPQKVRRNFYIHTDCDQDDKYLMLISNGQQGVSGKYNNGNESRAIGLENNWRGGNDCKKTTDCTLPLHENGLLRRVVEGNFLPAEDTCWVFIADNGSRWTHGEDTRSKTTLALANYIDRVVDVNKIEFAYVAAASRGVPISMGAMLELYENEPGDPAVPGSGWAAVPTVMTFNDGVFRSNDRNVVRSQSMVKNPIIKKHWGGSQNDKFYEIDFLAELGAKATLGNVRILNIVGGDEVAIAAGARASGSSRFEHRQDIVGWNNPIEVFAEECSGASEPYYTQVNVRFPLSHSELNGTLTTANAGGYTINPGLLYDTASLEFLAAGLVDFGIRSSGYAFEDGKGFELDARTMPLLYMPDGSSTPGASKSGTTVVESVSCAATPPPSCEDTCMDDLAACEFEFCVNNFDAFMCNQGCDLMFDGCMQACGY